jgi:hypothetical protein
MSGAVGRFSSQKPGVALKFSLKYHTPSRVLSICHTVMQEPDFVLVECVTETANDT